MTCAYQTGQFASTELKATAAGNELTIIIGAAKGTFRGTARSYEVRLPAGWPPESVSANGSPLSYAARADRPGDQSAVNTMKTPGGRRPSWRYEGNTLTTVVTTGKVPLTQALTIKVTRSPKPVSRRPELNGFAGAMTRLNDARSTLRRPWTFRNVPDDLLDAAQTGDRLGYFPESAGRVTAHYREELPRLKAKVEVLVKAGVSEEEKQGLEKALGKTWHTPEAQAAVADYPDKLARALAEINDAMVAKQ